jgi:hypothetical protein
MTEAELLAFFKDTVNAPPDVERFIASQQSLRGGELPSALESEMRKRGLSPQQEARPFFFEGAFAGGDFFIMGRTNAVDEGGVRPLEQPVYGRSGTNVYEIGIKSTTHSTEAVEQHPENPVSQWGAAQSRLVSELLRMGLGGLKAGSVHWSDLEFSAVSETGLVINGRLTVSNGIPQSLELSKQGMQAYTLLTYSYPDPADLLGGYPRQITRNERRGAEWRPVSAFTIYKLQRANTHLLPEFFSVARFNTTNHVFKTFASNGAFFSVTGDGKSVKLGPFQQFETGPQKKTKANSPWIFRCLMVFSGLSLIVLIFFGLKQKHSHPIGI